MSIHTLIQQRQIVYHNFAILSCCVPALNLQQPPRRLATVAKLGLDPTPDTIREGTVRMEQHPNYESAVAEIRRLEFEIKNTRGESGPYVAVREVLNPETEVIRVEKIVYVQEGMRYLDLEHELGHIRQLTERFGEKPLATERVIEYVDGRIKDISARGEVLTNWQNTITEYHNRLVEFLRLQERGANLELLREHARGVRHWRAQYREKGLKGGRSPTRQAWVQKHFPDILPLESRYKDTVGFALEL
ncbi:MAG: hypothetical protein DSM106950_15920 [Stigonema ocellatum SAG 48.90 = DSM 106950]|nr:hypothetical protein [Stigonema ocellatum SAG 48.90 = DSM 106950]